jgi:hypothetical protein
MERTAIVRRSDSSCGEGCDEFRRAAEEGALKVLLG